MNRRQSTLLIATGLLYCAATSAQVDISNPRGLMFVADSRDPIIDVIDLERQQVVHRIHTEYVVDDLVVTPYAPVLVYTNIDRKLVSVFNLKSKELAKQVELPIAPRHMVLDTTGSKIGFSDSKDGGFVLFSAYAASIIFTLADFPPTTDVLFDPNEVDVYYSNSRDGSLGRLDTNLKETFEIALSDTSQQFSSPSRSVDARYIYVANRSTGEIHSLNAFSKVIFKSFEIGDSPARPYTTPEGAFLYMIDTSSGRFTSIEQSRFEIHDSRIIGAGIDLVTVGRFDRMNLLASTENKRYYLYDNLRKAVIDSGEFEYTPLTAHGAADGRTAYVSFRDGPKIAVVDLETQRLSYLNATNNGIGASTIGLSNNVCH